MKDTIEIPKNKMVMVAFGFMSCTAVLSLIFVLTHADAISRMITLGKLSPSMIPTYEVVRLKPVSLIAIKLLYAFQIILTVAFSKNHVRNLSVIPFICALAISISCLFAINYNWVVAGQIVIAVVWLWKFVQTQTINVNPGSGSGYSLKVTISNVINGFLVIIPLLLFVDLIILRLRFPFTPITFSQMLFLFFGLCGLAGVIVWVLLLAVAIIVGVRNGLLNKFQQFGDYIWHVITVFGFVAFVWLFLKLSWVSALIRAFHLELSIIALLSLAFLFTLLSNSLESYYFPESSEEVSGVQRILNIIFSPISLSMKFLNHTLGGRAQISVINAYLVVLTSIIATALVALYGYFNHYFRFTHSMILPPLFFSVLFIADCLSKHKIIATKFSKLLGRSVLLLLASSLVLLPLTLTRPDLRYLLLQRSELGRGLTLLLKPIVDFDRDGYDRYLGGGDPNDFDPTVSPGYGNFDGFSTREPIEKYHDSEFPILQQERIPEKPLYFIWISMDGIRHEYMTTPEHPWGAMPKLVKHVRDRAIILDNHRANASATHMSMKMAMTGRYYSRFLRKTQRYPTFHDYAVQAGIKTIYYTGDVAPTIKNFPDGTREMLTLVGLPETIPPIHAYLKENNIFASKHPFSFTIHVVDTHFPWLFPEGDGPENPTVEANVRAKLKHADDFLDEFLSDLDRNRILDQSIIIITSDHGLEDMEHGWTLQGHTVYDTELKVPCLLVLPGESRRVIDAPTYHIDLLPTILPYLNYDVPHDLPGISILAATATLYDRDVYLGSSWEDTFGLITNRGRTKLIFDRLLNTWEIYDLFEDPGENQNLFDGKSKVQKSLQGDIRRMLIKHKYNFGDASLGRETPYNWELLRKR